MFLRTLFNVVCFSFVLYLGSLFFLPSDSFAATKKHLVGTVWYSYDTIKIYVQPAQPGSKPRFKYNMIEGNRFYIDIFGSKVKSSLNSAINLDDVQRLRRAQYDPKTSRVVIYFNRSGIKPSVSYVSGAKPYILVSWNGSSRSYSGKKFRILIDPGHGGKDKGATGPVKRLKEKGVTLDIALELEKSLLKRDDVVVGMTRRTDKTVGLSERMRIAQRWKADIFISIHANSNKNSALNQTEIYYYDIKSFDLARTVRDELIDELNRSEGQIRRYPYQVIYKNPAVFGSVLVESCYISSVRGENKLSQENYREAIADGLLNSINAFINTVNQQN